MTKFMSRLSEAQAAIIECEACPRLRTYCTHVAREKRRAFRNETYWGRPVPGFGDPGARLLLVDVHPRSRGNAMPGRKRLYR